MPQDTPFNQQVKYVILRKYQLKNSRAGSKIKIKNFTFT